MKEEKERKVKLWMKNLKSWIISDEEIGKKSDLPCAYLRTSPFNCKMEDYSH